MSANVFKNEKFEFRVFSEDLFERFLRRRLWRGIVSVLLGKTGRENLLHKHFDRKKFRDCRTQRRHSALEFRRGALTFERLFNGSLQYYSLSDKLNSVTVIPIATHPNSRTLEAPGKAL